MKKLIILISVVCSYSILACQINNLELKEIDPITGKEFIVTVKAFKPNKDKNRQVIILPPIGGTTLLENRYAKKVCNRGVAAYVFVNWTDDMEESVEDFEVHNRGTIRGVFAVEMFLKNFPLPTRILGTSLGGFYAGIAAGKFDLIEKVSIVASGTNLANVLATSNLDGLRLLKQKRMTLYKIESEAEYAQEIKKHLTIEAYDFKESLKEKKLLFFRTNSDDVILPKYQDELIDLFSKDNVSIYRTRFGHKSGIIYTSVRRANVIANFLAY